MTIGTWGNESLNPATQKKTKKRRSLVGAECLDFDRKSGVKICMQPQHPQKLIETKTDRILFLFVFVKLLASGLYLDSIFCYPPSPRTHP
jgi:hypothetical protein